MRAGAADGGVLQGGGGTGGHPVRLPEHAEIYERAQDLHEGCAACVQSGKSFQGVCRQERGAGPPAVTVRKRRAGRAVGSVREAVKAADGPPRITEGCGARYQILCVQALPEISGAQGVLRTGTGSAVYSGQLLYGGDLAGRV